MVGTGVKRTSNIVKFILSAHLALSAPSVMADAYSLSDVPLFVLEGVDPNIILTVDDSGSMGLSAMPNEIFVYSFMKTHPKQVLSSTVNKIYYNPDITYVPPLDKDGNSLGNARFTAAWSDGYAQSATCTVNLETSYRPTWGSAYNCNELDLTLEFLGEPQAAYYYQFDSVNCTDTSDESCYSKVQYDGTWADEEKTNFANWYSYYRKRIYLLRAAATRAFVSLDRSVRVGYQSLSSSSISSLHPFAGTHKTNFFNWLMALPPYGATPLRHATKRVGDYFSTAEPYREDPSDSSSEEISCRQNFHILMTDGGWNSTEGQLGNIDSSEAGLPDNTFNITSYLPSVDTSKIYQDDNEDYLADNAFYYWTHDLRPTLENNVPTSTLDVSTDIDGDGDVDNNDVFWNPANNPAEWQHMVNYTIGLGLNGKLSYPEDYNALLSGEKTWGNDKIDDLWHTAINSRGKYFSAQDTTSLVEAFKDVIKNIVDRTGSFAPVALNAGTISSATTAYLARFETESWSGHLIASRVSTGSNCGTTPVGQLCLPSWDAACILDGGSCQTTGTTVSAQSTRKIITSNGSGAGVAFQWSNLSSAQQNSLNDPDGSGPASPGDTADLGQNRLAFIRGDQSKETANGGDFRNRASLLGDIINSNPIYLGPPARHFRNASATDFSEVSSYAAYRTAYKNREEVVYVGANDGLLHAFAADDGEELFGFVPGKVFDNLWQLSKPNYKHASYVDGPLNEGDVYFADAWHSVLVGGLGLGGQGYYALDVTDPTAFSESNAADMVLWEFTDQTDADLGYSYGRPSIIRLYNGKWAAVFGNGINAADVADGAVSSNGNAVIFIVDIETGALIRKLDTRAGRTADPTGNSRSNGIIGIRAIDSDGDSIADRIYGGDLFGNIWVFDITGGTTSEWGSVYTNESAPSPLFRAVDSSGNAQPITTALQVDRHPNNDGFMVYFGTGKYLGNSDLSDTNTQTFYGIWDRASSDSDGATRSQLLQQTVTNTVTDQFANIDARVTSNHSITWDNGSDPQDSNEKFGWYIDLPESGERVHQEPTLRNGRVIFVTVTPSDDPCDAGGSSWLMELDAKDGSSVEQSVFDFNGDGVVNTTDLVDIDTANVVGSGIRKKNSGIYTRPAIAVHPDGATESKLMSTSKDRVENVTEDAGLNIRIPWRELR